ncbi:MAG: class I SAM-dependent methyltransferase [Kiritimatiellia bacterium]|jgi:predicted O-methyltransferase YrrM|nr:class I SAM-dependent methyltransferase [Kiritimatiellia bacterium]
MISRWEALKLALRHRPLLTKLIELRQNPLSVSYWSLIEKELTLLRQAVEIASKKQGPIVEIGTLFGFTTAMMASWMSGSNRLITVDNYSWNPWGILPDVSRELARKVLLPFTTTGKVVIMDMSSTEFYDNYKEGPPTLVFIDGDHTYEAVFDDIALAKKIGATMIGGHDYHPRAPGVIRAVDEHFSGAIARSDTVWIWGLH